MRQLLLFLKSDKKTINTQIFLFKGLSNDKLTIYHKGNKSLAEKIILHNIKVQQNEQFIPVI